MSSNNFEELRKQMIGNRLPAAGLVDMLKLVDAPTHASDAFEAALSSKLPPQVLTLEFLKKQHWSWALKTFGADQDPLLKGLAEMEELNKAPHDISEYADVLVCLLGGFSKNFPDLTAQDLLQAAYDKLEINKKRKWAPVPDKPGTWQHIK